MNGLIQVYTGNGKGKTTAAVGQVIRALGRGWKVAWIQYFKHIRKNSSGEIQILKNQGVKFFEIAPNIPLFKPDINMKQIIKECSKSLDTIDKIFKEKKYSLLVLDEINIAISKKFLSEKKLLKILLKKPSSIEVIITGRGKHKKIIQMADLVTEMKEIQHPYNKGIMARKGIEF